MDLHDPENIPQQPQKNTEAKPLGTKRFFENLSVRGIVQGGKTGNSKRRLPRGVMWGIGFLVLLFLVGFPVSLFFAKQQARNAIGSSLSSFQAGIADLQNLDPKSAQKKFASLQGTDNANVMIGWLGFLFQGGSGAVSAFMDITHQLTTLSSELAILETKVFDLLGNTAQGSELISHLKTVNNALASIDADSNNLSSAASLLGDSFFAEHDYLSLKTQVEGMQKFLNAFIPWFSSSSPRHVLVLLQNPSELRATGGFLGSYADVSIASGTIVSVSVHDIADADTTFMPKLVPPKPLQLEVARWRPADANWFFDFPTSASKTVAFFNQSTLYAVGTVASGTVAHPYFDGAIAISPKVVSDLLSVTGPITVTSSKTTFTSDNFMVQIQKIVQAGQASDATYPKQVLRNVVEGLVTKLASSTDEEKQNMLGMVVDWIAKKDVMTYFDDPDFENFFVAHGMAGEVYALPQNFNGDYLAVVNTNVNGGKSDLYVNEKISWTVQVDADGIIADNLIIDRKHTGNTSPYWWYQAPNQTYLQMFVPTGSTLTNESGGLSRTVIPKVNYTKSGYSTDPFVANIESSTQVLFNYPVVSSHSESGKEVFATWSRVAAGSSAELSFDYTHHAFSLPDDGVAYRFVFEKQAGTNRSYSFEINAPLGYEFAETNLPSWTYRSNDIPGRMIVNLTLQKI